MLLPVVNADEYKVRTSAHGRRVFRIRRLQPRDCALNALGGIFDEGTVRVRQILQNLTVVQLGRSPLLPIAVGGGLPGRGMRVQRGQFVALSLGPSGTL